MCSYLMGNVAIRIEDMVCQNPRGWRVGTGEELKGENEGGGKKPHRHSEVEIFTTNKTSSNWAKY